MVSSTMTSAAIVSFDFRAAGKEAEIESGSYLVDGVTISLSTPTLNGVLNRTSSGFGVNITSDGSDDSDTIDGDAGSESIRFSFSSAGSISGFTFGAVTTGDSMILRKNGLQIATVSGSSFSYSDSFTATDQYVLEHNSGNGLSWNSVTVNAVPEPSSSLLLGFGGLVGLSRRKRDAS